MARAARPSRYRESEQKAQRRTGARRERVRRPPRRHHGLGRRRRRRKAQPNAPQNRMGPAQSLWLACRPDGHSAICRRWHVGTDPGVRILEGLADLEARDGAGQDTTLRERLKQLRKDGAPFSLTIIGPSGRFLEADGRTAAARAVLWITDTTIKGLEESGARARFEEARAAVARDPMAFLEMLGKAPFPAWRMSGAGKLQWVNKRLPEGRRRAEHRPCARPPDHARPACDDAGAEDHQRQQRDRRHPPHGDGRRAPRHEA